MTTLCFLRVGCGLLRRGARRCRFYACTRDTGAQERAGVSVRVRLYDASDTERLGGILGNGARGGDTVLLHGDLGVGKTCFARGFVRSAIGDQRVDVTSPTFLLVNEYANEMLKVYHMDLWRLKDVNHRAIVRFDEVFKRHIALIEWPDRLGAITPDDRLDVSLKYDETGDDEVDDDDDDPWGLAQDAEDAGRIATMVSTGEQWRTRLEKLRNQLSTEGRLLVS